MPDTGAPWNIPYVEPSDLVRTYPAADEAQALAVAAGLTAASNIVAVHTSAKTDVFTASVASGASTAITGLSLAGVAAASATNKLLLIVSLGVTGRQLGVAVDNGSGLVLLGDAAGSRGRVTTGQNYDAARPVGSMTMFGVLTPGDTTVRTYDAHAINFASTTFTVTVNRVDTDTDDVRHPRGASFFHIIEVAA